MKTVAIIGAGLSGLSAAHGLISKGEQSSHISVMLFDKSRGVGGRMSTRYAGPYEFDHGAQYFTARSPEFIQVLNRALTEGHVAPWAAKACYLKDGVRVADTGGARFVGTPRMNSWAKALAAPLSVQLSARVSAIKRDLNKPGWSLEFEDGKVQNGFDQIICAVPPRQALEILPKDFKHRGAIQKTKMDVCFALMIGLEARPDFGWDTLRVNNLPVGWISINSQKPRRGQAGTLVIHSAPDWSNLHAEHDRDWVQETLISVASELTGIDLSGAPHVALHRWLYSSVARSAGSECLYDADLDIAVCGDWCVGGRVEGAFLSGLSAAQALAKTV